MKAWKTTGKVVYGLVGTTAIGTAVWGFMNLDKFATMGLFGSIAFWLLTIGGINWGVKLALGKDIFGN